MVTAKTLAADVYVIGIDGVNRSRANSRTSCRKSAVSTNAQKGIPIVPLVEVRAGSDISADAANPRREIALIFTEILLCCSTKILVDRIPHAHLANHYRVACA